MSAVRVAIVDPYSSGALLAEALRAQNIDVLAIESSAAIPACMKSGFDPHVYRDVIQHAEDSERTVQRVSRYQPTHIIAGFESGVELAEWLSDQLGLPTNDPLASQARRDKFLMTELAARHGLRTAQQFCSHDVAELLAWTNDNLDWPAIVKPTRSVASDHVFCCRSVDEVRRAAESILSEPNVLGCRNDRVLVQEFLHGTEYAVDTVSYGGLAKLTAVWQYDRPDNAAEFVCYDAMRILPYTGFRQDALRACAFRLLEALGIGYGPAHCELMWVDDAPVVIEVGARMSAGINAVLSRVCGGISQLDETVSTLCDPDVFVGTLSNSPRLQQHAANVFLRPPYPGTLIRVRNVEMIHKLPTLHSMSITTEPGSPLQRVAGRVTLVSSEPCMIDRDIQSIREIERDGIFEVEPKSSAQIRLPGDGP